MKVKVVIFGTGKVGATIANDLLYCDLDCEIWLVNRSIDKLWAESQELSLCENVIGASSNIFMGTSQDCLNADILIVTASDPYYIGSKREDYIISTKSLIDSLAYSLNHSDFDGVVIVVSNPVDFATNYLIKHLKKFTGRILGTGTSIDTQRIRLRLKEYGAKINYNMLACVGMHGEKCFVPKSLVKKAVDCEAGDIEIDETYKKFMSLIERINMESNKIMAIKGATTWGIASIVVEIVRAIVHGDDIIMPVTHNFFQPDIDREVCLSFPARICKSGIKETIYVKLTQGECDKINSMQNYLLSLM